MRTVRRLPTEWVTRELRSRRGDLMASVRFKEASRREGAPEHLILHMEHQSRPDSSMPFRFLEYGYEFLRELAASGLLGSECPILCVVIHNGKSPWNEATRTPGLGPVPSADARGPLAGTDLSAFFPWGYRALDLVRHRGEAPIPGSIVSLMVAIEYAGADGLAALFRDARLAETWRGLPGALQLTVARWIGRIAEQLGIDVEMDELMQLPPLAKVTSRLEESIDEAIDDARAKGMEKGMAEERSLLRGMAALKFGEPVASRLAALLGDLARPAELRQAGACIMRSSNGEELLSRLSELVRRRGNGANARLSLGS